MFIEVLKLEPRDNYIVLARCYTNEVVALPANRYVFHYATIINIKGRTQIKYNLSIILLNLLNTTRS